jgi:hypothetical protein
MGRRIGGVATFVAILFGGCATAPDPVESPMTVSEAPAAIVRASEGVSTPSARAEVTPPAPDGDWPIASEEPAVWYLRDFNGRQLVLVVEVGGDRRCSRFSRLEVEESAQQIHVQAFIGYSDWARAGRACGLARLVHEERVVLEGFLDGRALTGCLLHQLPMDLRDSCSDIVEDR